MSSVAQPRAENLKSKNLRLGAKDAGQDPSVQAFPSNLRRNSSADLQAAAFPMTKSEKRKHKQQIP
jgi:hypothetical protein